MAEYDLIRNLLRLIPIMFILIMIFVLRKRVWHVRFALVVVLGWIAIAIFTQVFWDYSVDHAPTVEMQNDLVMRDGGPRAGGMLFGWLDPLLFVAMYEICRLTCRAFLRVIKN